MRVIFFNEGENYVIVNNKNEPLPGHETEFNHLCGLDPEVIRKDAVYNEEHNKEHVILSKSLMRMYNRGSFMRWSKL